jgi:hypothetical protein
MKSSLSARWTRELAQLTNGVGLPAVLTRSSALPDAGNGGLAVARRGAVQRIATVSHGRNTAAARRQVASQRIEESEAIATPDMDLLLKARRVEPTEMLRRAGSNRAICNGIKRTAPSARV